jgi:hypothetical protein
MPTLDELHACRSRLLLHRSKLRARRLSAWFYKRKALEAKVYARLAKLSHEIDRVERQIQNRRKS